MLFKLSNETGMNLSLMANYFVSLGIDILFFGFIPIAVEILVLCVTKKGEATSSIDQSLDSQPGEEESMHKQNYCNSIMCHISIFRF